MTLKVTGDPVVYDLRSGERSTFLGFDCGLVKDQVDVTVARRSIEKLKNRLLELDGDPNAPRAAATRLLEWFVSQAPAYSKPHARRIVREFVNCLREIRIARKKIGDVPLGRQRDWLEDWQRLHNEWSKRVRKSL